MSEKQGFLNALQETPDDRVTRQVYADWLEENGEADKAAFLRLLLIGHTGTTLLESMRQTARWHGREFTIHQKRAPGPEQPMQAKGKWSHRELQDTDRFLYPVIA